MGKPDDGLDQARIHHFVTQLERLSDLDLNEVLTEGLKLKESRDERLRSLGVRPPAIPSELLQMSPLRLPPGFKEAYRKALASLGDDDR